MRAMSSLDIALWDLNAKHARLPLYRLLGGYPSEVDVYASGGYYAAVIRLRTWRPRSPRTWSVDSTSVKIKVGGSLWLWTRSESNLFAS